MSTRIKNSQFLSSKNFIKILENRILKFKHLLKIMDIIKIFQKDYKECQEQSS